MSEGTKRRMMRAKKLIEAQRYEDARALLVTIDHPTADKWLAKLNSMSPAIAASADKSFTTQLVIAILLLFAFVIPGIIALSIFANEAKRYPNAPGAKGLIWLNRFMFWLLAIPLSIVAAIVILAAVIS